MAASGDVSDSGHWHSRYLRGDIPWEKEAPAPPLCEFLAKEKVSGKVLVPGCGSGHDVRELARHGATVTGLDFAPGAIELAQNFPRVSDENYVCADFFELPPGHRGAYDFIFEHTCFCAIDPARRREYVAAALSALKPGGKLLAIFFLNPDNDEGGPPYGVSTAELDSLFSMFDLVCEWVPSQVFEGREKRELLRLLRKR